MKLDVSWRNENLVITLTGALTMDNAGRLVAQLRSLIAPPCRRCILDLAALESIDSSGIGALATSVDTARERQATLVLCAVPARVRQTIEIARADRFLALFPDVDAAVNAP
ncbi:MAG TPA: STAS domain-containing protein [Kiritimatiellia bacterium]|nr:STAS domain-containing protein [Kiritimatiellia bacterium]HMP34817.1 STAS domain-containing protein [Kiritimatiellia bacterium]